MEVLKMQKDINVVIGNSRGKYGNRKYQGFFKNEYGSIGSYFCESETLHGSITECHEVAKNYAKTDLFDHEEIIPLFISELHEQGNRTIVYEF